MLAIDRVRRAHPRGEIPGRKSGNTLLISCVGDVPRPGCRERARAGAGVSEVALAVPARRDLRSDRLRRAGEVVPLAPARALIGHARDRLRLSVSVFFPTEPA
jgi:hypothetical protein